MGTRKEGQTGAQARAYLRRSSSSTDNSYVKECARRQPVLHTGAPRSEGWPARPPFCDEIFFSFRLRVRW